MFCECTRRDFLRSAAATAALGALPPLERIGTGRSSGRRRASLPVAIQHWHRTTQQH